MIEVQNLVKYYGNKAVLHGIDFSVPAGSVTGLVGPNGSGKSTTIRVIAGFHDADQGCVHVCDEPMSVSAKQVKRNIGYAPESAPSYFDQTTREYLHFIAGIRNIPKAQRAQEVHRVATEFAVVEVLDRAIGTLSKGYRHRVCLAQAIVGDPPVIILDEPTDGLDPLQKIETRKIILALAKDKAVLLTTHLLEEVEELCDRIVMLDKGRVAYAGSYREVVDAGVGELQVWFELCNTDKATVDAALMGLGTSEIRLDTSGEHIQGHVVFPIGMTSGLAVVSDAFYQQGIQVLSLYKKTHGIAKLFESLN